MCTDVDTVEILQAGDKDIPVIEEILEDVRTYLDEIKNPQWGKVTWEKLSRSFEAKDFYIAYLNGIPAGCMSLTDFDPEIWPDIPKGQSLYIHKLAVKRIGAGGKISLPLMNFAKKQAVQKGMELRLDCHKFREKVLRFYENQGFRCVGWGRFFGAYDAALYVWNGEM